MLKKEEVKEGEWVGQRLLPLSEALGKDEWINPIHCWLMIHKSLHQVPHGEWIKSIQKFLNTKVMCPYSTNAAELIQKKKTNKKRNVLPVAKH